MSFEKYFIRANFSFQSSKMSKFQVLLFLTLAICLYSKPGSACRVGSERLKSYVRQTIESLLKPSYLGTIYWPDEPLDSDLLVRATGINISTAETQLRLDKIEGGSNNDDSMIRDIFLTCSIDRDRSYTLAVNLEIDNPFKSIDVAYEIPLAAMRRESNNSIFISEPIDVSENEKRYGRFIIRLPQSTFLVHLKQRIRYDECININYVQLAPSVSHSIECISCDKAEQKYLDKIFSKRMTQFDAELDSLLSQKFLLGLQLLLNQQRLDLELFIE